MQRHVAVTEEENRCVTGFVFYKEGMVRETSAVSLMIEPLAAEPSPIGDAKKKENSLSCSFSFWRRMRDSNPRGLSP